MQDRVITELGAVELSSNKDLSAYEQYVQEITPGKVTTIALVVFERLDGVIRYRNIDVGNVNRENYKRFAYRKGSPRGGDITFTTKFGDISKKLKTLNTIQWPALLRIAEEVSSEEFLLLQEWHQALKQDLQRIQNDLNAFHVGLDKIKQQSSAFSLALEVNGQMKLAADFESIRKQILLSGTQGKKEKYNVISEGKDNLCSICCKVKPVLYGFASPFKFATVDKPGTVSGFFTQKNNWINYPICHDCSLQFEWGKNYVTKNLSRSFFGRRYYLIPKTILRNDEVRLRKALKQVEAIAYDIGKSDHIERREDYLMERLGALDNLVALNLLFYEENATTKAIKIKLMLEEIPPSRFRTLFVEIPRIVNKHSLYIDADYNFKKKEKKDLKFSFSMIQEFFNDNFYDIVHKIFMGHPINRSEVFRRFMQIVRQNYNKQLTSDAFVESRLLTVLKAHLVLRYLQHLEIVSTTNFTPMSSETEENKQNLEKKMSFDIEKFRAFLNTNKDFFSGDEVIGVFALGILVSLVFSIQQVNLGSTPFENKLKGLNLSANDLQKLYVESISKINQYTSTYAYKELRELITESLTRSTARLRRISNQELSFYFVAGMELGRKFKSEKDAVPQD